MEDLLTSSIANLNDAVTLLSCTPGGSELLPDDDSTDSSRCFKGHSGGTDWKDCDFIDKITGKVLSTLELLLKLSRTVNYANDRDIRAKRLIEKMKTLAQTQALAIEKLSTKPVMHSASVNTEPIQFLEEKVNTTQLQDKMALLELKLYQKKIRYLEEQIIASNHELEEEKRRRKSLEFVVKQSKRIIETQSNRISTLEVSLVKRKHPDSDESRPRSISRAPSSLSTMTQPQSDIEKVKSDGVYHHNILEIKRNSDLHVDNSGSNNYADRKDTGEFNFNNNNVLRGMMKPPLPRAANRDSDLLNSNRVLNGYERDAARLDGSELRGSWDKRNDGVQGHGSSTVVKAELGRWLPLSLDSESQENIDDFDEGGNVEDSLREGADDANEDRSDGESDETEYTDYSEEEDEGKERVGDFEEFSGDHGSLEDKFSFLSPNSNSIDDLEFSRSVEITHGEVGDSHDDIDMSLSSSSLASAPRKLGGLGSPARSVSPPPMAPSSMAKSLVNGSSFQASQYRGATSTNVGEAQVQVNDVTEENDSLDDSFSLVKEYYG